MKVISIAAMGLILGAPAFAGDVTRPTQQGAPEIVTQSDFALGGDWTGAYVGGQYGYADMESSTNALNGNGFLGGLHAGYQLDYGSYVVGGEFDYDIADIDLGGATGTVDEIYRLKLKVGLDTGDVLYYGLVGGARANVEIGGVKQHDTGYLYGVGSDIQITESVVLGGQVIYHDFSDFNDTGTDIDALTVQGRVSFNF